MSIIAVIIATTVISTAVAVRSPYAVLPGEVSDTEVIDAVSPDGVWVSVKAVCGAVVEALVTDVSIIVVDVFAG